MQHVCICVIFDRDIEVMFCCVSQCTNQLQIAFHAAQTLQCIQFVFAQTRLGITQSVMLDNSLAYTHSCPQLPTLNLHEHVMAYLCHAQIFIRVTTGATLQ